MVNIRLLSIFILILVVCIACNIQAEFVFLSESAFEDMLNTDETGSSSATLVINELDSDTLSTDVLEFVELYDGGVGNTDLTGCVLVFYNGNTDVSYLAIDLDGYFTDANGFFLLGNSGVTPVPDINFGTNVLQNGPDAVVLYKGDAASFPDGTGIILTNIIDAVVYGTTDPDDIELLPLLNTGQPQVDEDGGGDGISHSIQRSSDGSGGQRNTSTFIQALPTPKAPN